MGIFKFWGVALTFLVGSSGLAAARFALPQLDPSQTTPIFNTLVSAMAFRPVSPASSDGIWGFSVGVTGIQASTEQITSLIGTGTPNIYNGDVNGMVQIPFGLAIEAGFIPSMNISGVSVNRFGLDVKWTFTDLLSGFPLDGALRASYTNGFLSYSQPLNGGTVNVSYNTNIYGGTLSLSKKFAIVEPYVTYGILQHSSNLSGTGSASFFDNNFPANTTSVSGSGSSGWFTLGAQLKLGWFILAAEYDNMFLDDTYAIRLAFGI